MPRDVMFLELELPYDRHKATQEPLIVAVDQIEAISPSEYSDGGISRRNGAAVRTRSGETFLVAETVARIRELLTKAVRE